MSEELQRSEFPEKYGAPQANPSLGYIPFPPFPQFPDIPPSTDLGEVNPLLSVQKKSWRKRWITITLLTVFVFASVASFLVIRYINRSTPDKTLDTFCNALQHADYQSAYNQFSAKLQQTISEAMFAATLSQDRVIACAHDTTGDPGNNVTNTLKLVHASKGINTDIVTLTKDSNNDWKIDDIYRLSSLLLDTAFTLKEKTGQQSYA
jgi:hypothetical protein